MSGLNKVLLIMGIIMLIPFFSYSTIIQVPLEQPTIQSALDIAYEDDTIIVAAGDYEEHLVFGEVSVTVLSADGSEVTFISKKTMASR